MSLSKSQIEWMRLEAQKCDHRGVTPQAYFDIAATLRASQGRGGRMFEKQKNKTDNPPAPTTKPSPKKGAKKYKMPGPVPWQGLQEAGVRTVTAPRWNETPSTRQKAPPPQPPPQDDDAQGMTEEERLEKLRRILGYLPAELQKPPAPPRGPRYDLRKPVQMPAIPGKNFNRNAKGWRATGEVSDGQAPQSDQPQPANPAAFEPAALQLDIPDTHYGGATRPKSWPSSLLEAANTRLELLLQGDYNARPQGWHSVEMESPNPYSEVPYGDYNPRPKAWIPTEEDLDEESITEGELQHGDYNARPKPWESSGPQFQRGDVRYGDYNPRPKAWWSSHATHYFYKPGRIASTDDSGLRDGMSAGDFNPRPKAWRPAHSKHYVYKPEPAEQMKFADFNARAKAWQGRESQPRRSKKGIAPRDVVGLRPKSWQAGENWDSDSESTLSSLDSEHSYYVYLGQGRNPFQPVSDV